MQKPIAPGTLETPAQLITEAQGQVKVVIRNAMFQHSNSQALSVIRKQVQNIIKTTTDKIVNVELRQTARLEIQRFADVLVRQSLVAVGFSPAQSLLVLTLWQQGKPLQQAMKQVAPEYIEIAQPNKVFSPNYMRRVQTTLEEINRAEPKYADGVSLRNIAEMTVRHDKTLEDIAELKAKGENLVFSSTHANASVRCEKWQGGFYTLDNTYVVVDDIQFQPLSNATDHYYTTRAGKVYRNGHITGYNCRHYLTPYRKGRRPIQVSAQEVAKQRAIDTRMREMERQVRFWREKAELWDGVDELKYKSARNTAKQVNANYMAFAKANGRAYYPSRTTVL